jgi:hypothetical protein
MNESLNAFRELIVDVLGCLLPGLSFLLALFFSFLLPSAALVYALSTDQPPYPPMFSDSLPYLMAPSFAFVIVA